MKKTALSIAAAAAITLGAAGAATAGVSVAKAGLFEGSSAAQTQTVHHRGWHHHHGHRYRHRRMCRRLYYRGFVLGHWRARRAYYRLCRYRRPYYGY